MVVLYGGEYYSTARAISHLQILRADLKYTRDGEQAGYARSELENVLQGTPEDSADLCRTTLLCIAFTPLLLYRGSQLSKRHFDRWSLISVSTSYCRWR